MYQEDTEVNALQIQRYDYHLHKHQFYQYGFKYPYHHNQQYTTELTSDRWVLRSQSSLKAIPQVLYIWGSGVNERVLYLP